MKPWKKIDSKIILDTEHFRVRQDIVRLPNDKKKTWTYWDSRDSAMVIGMTKDKKLVMIRQFRYLVDDFVLEFSSGSLNDGDTPEEAARREFNEECGYDCSNLMKLGSFYETYGQLNRQIHIFFSSCIEKSKQMLDSGDRYEDIEVELMKYEDVQELALNNKLDAMGSTLAMLLLHEKIRKNEITL